MPKKSPLSAVVAARCSADLLAKLDKLVEVLTAASPIAVNLRRSDVARAALEAGADTLLQDHRTFNRRVR